MRAARGVIALTIHPSPGTIYSRKLFGVHSDNSGHSLMVKFQPSKLAMRVRFPLPAHYRVFNFICVRRLAYVYGATLRFCVLHGPLLRLPGVFRVLDRTR